MQIEVLKHKMDEGKLIRHTAIVEIVDATAFTVTETNDLVLATSIACNFHPDIYGIYEMFIVKRIQGFDNVFVVEWSTGYSE